MLKTTKEFDFVYKNSFKFRSESLDICVLRANMAGQFYEKFRRLPCNFVGFSVSKKVGNAVERNLIKRRLRAICREFFGMGNSPLGLHSADFGIFGASQTPSLVSAPKIPKNYESQTENASVVDSLHESKDKKTPSLRGRIVDSLEAIQKNNVDCHDSALPNLAMTENNANRVKSRNAELELQKDKRDNLICIFIAKGQILQTPFIALKSTIFATLKKQLNFKKNSHFAPKMANRYKSPKRESTKMSNRPQTKAMQNENR